MTPASARASLRSRNDVNVTTQPRRAVVYPAIPVNATERGLPMPLKVVGAGLGRTGTHSLKVALERLTALAPRAMGLVPEGVR